MIRLLVITTKGCEACKLTQTNIIKYLNINNNKEITFMSKDISEIEDSFKKEHKLTDFPTIFLIKDNVVSDKYIGYMSRTKLEKFLNI